MTTSEILPVPFPFGTIVTTHKIGDYSIIEYIVGSGWADKGKILFQGPQASWPTLDMAILDCMCSKYNPGFQDERLAIIIARTIGMPESETTDD